MKTNQELKVHPVNKDLEFLLHSFYIVGFGLNGLENFLLVIYPRLKFFTGVVILIELDSFL